MVWWRSADSEGALLCGTRRLSASKCITKCINDDSKESDDGMEDNNVDASGFIGTADDGENEGMDANDDDDEALKNG